MHRSIETIPWYGGEIFADKPRKKRQSDYLPPYRKPSRFAAKCACVMRELFSKKARKEARKLFAAYKKSLAK